MLSGVMDTPNVLRGLYATVESIDCSHSALAHRHSYTDKNGETQYAEQNYYFVDGGDTEGTFRFTFTAEADGDIYAHFPGVLFQGMSTECGLYVNGTKVSDYYTNETWVIQNLGTFEKGDEIKVELRFTNGDLYISRASRYFFYYIDYSAMNVAFSQLEAASMYVEEYGNDFLKGTIDLPEGQDLIFTEPQPQGARACEVRQHAHRAFLLLQGRRYDRMADGGLGNCGCGGGRESGCGGFGNYGRGSV